MNLMKVHNKNNKNPYDLYADTLAKAYDQVKTTDVLPFLADILPQARRSQEPHFSALDIGCGSGRDSYWLAHKMNFKVTAVDASSGMLKYARQHHKHPNIEYVEDALPRITKLLATKNKFDVILMSAVLMHFAKDDREKIFLNILKLINPAGFIYLTLRRGKHLMEKDMHTVPVREIERLCQQNKIALHNLGRTADARGREGISWHHVALYS